MLADPIRYCPKCKTERPFSELFCEGLVADASCEWSLSDEPLRQPGWRPPVLVTEETAQAVQASSVCTNGHDMAEDDFICMTCGSDRAAPSLAQPTPEDATRPQTPAQTETVETAIDGWRLVRQLSSTPRVRDRYIARHEGSGREGVLTLYHHGAEPDPAIYDVLRRLPHDHVPELLATGRWDERAYEVSENVTGGTLKDLGIVATDVESIRRIVFELGKALHSFSEVGLRHRDIRPATLLVRQREPLDLVIGGFGSARLSDFDLDIVSPLEVTRYMAPEAVAGGVAAASDWWSLGMVLLEQVTKGACFEGINEHAYLIHVLANGVPLPDELPQELDLLFRGLLARDRLQRWQWAQVKAWLNGDVLSAPPRVSVGADDQSGAASLELNGRKYRLPLSLETGSHELGAYDVRLGKPGLPGTLEIARQLGFRHPRMNGNGRSAPWVITTDLLFTLVDESGARKLLAVACKPRAELDERTKKLLAIEQAYWIARGVGWLLITPDQYEEAVELTLRCSFQWWQGEPVSDEAKLAATSLARQLEGFPLSYVLDRIDAALGQGFEYAQGAFWQSVWTRALPLDLRRGWRPHLPVELLSPSEFLAFNPIASRRTAWN